MAMEAQIHTILSLAILLFLPAGYICAGENLFSNSVHWPSDGDKVTKTHYEYVDAANDTLVWDFSAAIETGGTHIMQWVNIGDSIIVKSELGSQSTYVIKGDSVIWNAYENPLLDLRDSGSLVIGRLKSPQGELTSPFCFQGTFCGNNHVSSEGTLSMRVSSRGTLILPNDTIEDAIKVTRRTEGVMHVANGKIPVANDEADRNMALNHVVVIDRWYAPGFKYELAENISDRYYVNDELVKETCATFLCPPDEQEYSIGAFRAPDGTKSRHPERPDRRRKENDPNGIPKRLADNISINHGGNVIDVALRGEGPLNTENAPEIAVSGILCDQLGRIWRTFSGSCGVEDAWHTQISTDGLPQGNYILYLSIGEEAMAHKLIIK